MKFEMGSMKIIMMNTAIITARIMTMRCSAKPTAVMTESMENTTSITMMVPTAWGSPMRWRALCSSEVSALISVRRARRSARGCPL